MNALAQLYYSIHNAIFTPLKHLDGLAPLALLLWWSFDRRERELTADGVASSASTPPGAEAGQLPGLLSGRLFSIQS